MARNPNDRSLDDMHINRLPLISSIVMLTLKNLHLLDFKLEMAPATSQDYRMYGVLRYITVSLNFILF